MNYHKFQCLYIYIYVCVCTGARLYIDLKLMISFLMYLKLVNIRSYEIN